ncbi:hypothetical protein [Pseudonocardia acaciae]|uniref:hypothetical protein n=1 Tax=Pseudonocardia acaciae TaxID=551276 RepID=UPI000A8303B5|nr:hypothetical protein [Pseudonocardia acaciae]
MTVNQARSTRSQVARAALWALRVGVAVLLITVLGQGLLASRYIGGDFTALKQHSQNAAFVAYAAAAVLLAALVHWIAGGRLWPVPVSVALLGGTVLQFRSGFERIVPLHVALGIALVAATSAMVVAAWRPGASR